MTQKQIQKELHSMGFDTIEELQKALKEYKEKNFPEDCIPEIEIDFKYLDELNIDFSFLDEVKEEQR